MAHDPLLRWDWEGGAPGPAAAGMTEPSVRVSPPAALNAPSTRRHDDEQPPTRPFRRRR
jgi:hypothetical protein